SAPGAAFAGESQASSIAAGQTEDVLRYEVQDHVVADRGGHVEAGFAKLALYVHLFDEAVAAVGVHASVGGLPGGLRGEELGQVGLGAARFAVVEQPGRFVAHEAGGEHAGVGLGDGKLNALV